MSYYVDDTVYMPKHNLNNYDPSQKGSLWTKENSENDWTELHKEGMWYRDEVLQNRNLKAFIRRSDRTWCL